MIFGSKPTYIYGEYNRKKFHCLGKNYSFDPIPVQPCSCPVKLINDKLEIFYPGPIFNTYVISIEEHVAILKSFDDKLTVIKIKDGKPKSKDNLSEENKLEESRLYTVKIITEDETTREVEIYKFNDFFPGSVLKGTVEIKNNHPIACTKLGKGKITLQNNDIKKDVDCMLVKIEGNEECTFVEINNPIDRTAVRILKDLKNNKIVENGNIKGILLDCKNKKIGDEVNVFVKSVYIGSYAFIEDIIEGGIYSVELVSKQGNISKVKYKDFIGECYDKKVNKIMKGVIYDIKGKNFKFKRSDEHEPISNTRTDSFETVKASKKMKITSENDINGDQLKAIEYIKGIITKDTESEEELIKLINKYIMKCSENDYLMLFYLEFLMQRNLLTEGEISKIVKNSSEKFYKHIAATISDQNVLKLIFNKKKSLPIFLELLPMEKNKAKFIQDNPEFNSSAIDYIYKNIENPRVLVESIITDSYKSWVAYLNNENGQFKRNLFRRAIKMKFKKNEMKTIFKIWAEFEESQNGNVEEVHSLALKYVEDRKNQ